MSALVGGAVPYMPDWNHNARVAAAEEAERLSPDLAERFRKMAVANFDEQQNRIVKDLRDTADRIAKMKPPVGAEQASWNKHPHENIADGVIREIQALLFNMPLTLLYARAVEADRPEDS